jgi:hypothetical protein
MTDRLDLPRRCREALEALLREHVPNAEVWAYGRSRVNGRCHSGSDLDLVLRSPTLEPLGSEYVEEELVGAKVRALPTAAGAEYVG